jgi:hypothetical protein
VPRVQSHRKLARQRRLPAASAANHHDPLRDRPSRDRTRRHARNGTSRGAGGPRRSPRSAHLACIFMIYPTPGTSSWPTPARACAI